MITAQQFVTAVEAAAAEIREYSWGASGQNGKCDCIGLIMDALRKCGMKWPGVHGTNWAARNAMETLDHIADARKMILGQVVFKARGPGNDRYKLPNTYKNSGDLLDYYHVGVVTSIDPLVITHCTDVPGGIKRDTDLGTWRWGGELKYVDYDAEETPMECLYKATVHANNGYPVKMRKLPSTQSSVILQVPLGATVEVTGEVDAVWAAINYQGKDGYMMRKFLRKADSEPISGTAVAVNRADLETIKTALETALNVIDKMLVG